MIFDPEKITFFAKTDTRGSNVPFGIKAKDRTKHMYVIGKTGMGKSTLLENMAVQDIANGEGMAFIDPHGQTAETLLDFIPEHRKDDVLYFAPFDTNHPVAFNVMEDVGPDKRHLVVSGLMSVFKKIWLDAWSARMEYILQNTLLALLEYPDSTLLGVNRMLSDKKYRKLVVDNIQDPAVKSFWVDEFANYNERYMQEAGDAIKNKIGQFTANPLIRNIIGQPKSSFDLREILDDQKILIMNLSKGLVGESNANLLGSMLTTRIYLAAMSRADMTASEMQQAPNFYFYVDEFQSFANATFADILSEARKYKLNLTIAHQYVEQMEEEVRNAVFGNVGTIVSFRVGPFDAEILETIFNPQFYAVDICNLGFAQVYLTLMIDGIGSKPFSAVTLPPIAAKSESCKEMVIHASRTQFAVARDEVEQAINTWHAPPPDTASNRSPKNTTAQDRRPKAKPQPNKLRNGTPPNRPRREESSSKKPSAPAAPPQKSRTPETAQPPDTAATSKEKDERPHNEQTIQDLRSILKTITPQNKAASQEENATKAPQKTPPAETKPKKQSDKKGESTQSSASPLKSALAEILKEVPDKPASQTTDQPKETPPNATPASSSKSVTAAPDTTTAKQASNKTVSNSTSSGREAQLDPKKLERMMRVSMNEKPPFK